MALSTYVFLVQGHVVRRKKGEQSKTAKFRKILKIPSKVGVCIVFHVKTLKQILRGVGVGGSKRVQFW